MSEQTIGAVLEADHHLIDTHFAAFAASLTTGEPSARDLAAAAEGLRHHIWVEEEFHFPPLRAAGQIGPIMVMLLEHGKLWDLLDAMEAGVAAGEPVAEYWAELEPLLEAHNMKEERILYSSGDELLDASTADAVRRAMSEPMPQGWVCSMAGRSG